jgi:hypothetical protein
MGNDEDRSVGFDAEIDAGMEGGCVDAGKSAILWSGDAGSALARSGDFPINKTNAPAETIPDRKFRRETFSMTKSSAGFFFRPR